MPRTLRHRADEVSRDNDSDPSSSEPDDTAPRRSPQRLPQSQTQRRRRSTSNSGSDAQPGADLSDPEEAGKSTQTLQPLTKKLVRLALSTEYARQPLRRNDINTKIIKDNSSSGAGGQRVNFRAVFNGAQKVLREVFGMELIDLPSREKVGLLERRKQATQAAVKESQAGKSKGKGRGRAGAGNDEELETQATQRTRERDPVASAQSWILVSCLPEEYRVHPELSAPARAPDEGSESIYTALYTVVISLIYLHSPSGGGGGGGMAAETQRDRDQETQRNTEANGGDKESQVEDTIEPLSDTKLLRYLTRLGIENYTPASYLPGSGSGVGGSTLEKLLARMIREGYVEKRRDTTGGDEIIEWVVGPRGKREIGRKGVAGLVRGVYGFGVDGTGKGLEVPQQESEDEQEVDGVEGGDDEDGQRRRPVKIRRAELERRLKRTLG